MSILSREEKRKINTLFNHLFSRESKMKFLKVLYPSTTIDLNRYRNNDMKVDEIFDELFTLEDKIEGIKLHYEVQGHDFETIKDILENKEIIEENEYCTDWIGQRERRKQKRQYI